MKKKLINSIFVIFVILITTFSIIQVNYYNRQAQIFFDELKQTLSSLDEGDVGTFSLKLPANNNILFFTPYFPVELSGLGVSKNKANKINNFFNRQDDEYGLMWLDSDNNILAVRYATDILTDLDLVRSCASMMHHWESGQNKKVTVCIRKNDNSFEFINND